MTATDQAAQAELLRSLHIPGEPLILTNVWDAVTARVVAAVPGVRAIATASHSISDAHGVPDGEGLSLDEALAAAKVIIDAVEMPVTVDFERGYAADAAGVEASVARLIETGAHGLNIEDSTGRPDAPLAAIDEQVTRVAAVRAAAQRAGIPLVINARVDTLFRTAGDGDVWSDVVARANAYLDAGADVAFVLGLSTEDLVKRAVADIHGPVSMIGGGTVPLKRLAELGIARVSFANRPLRVTLSHLQRAATTLTALGDYPDGLDFVY